MLVSKELVFDPAIIHNASTVKRSYLLNER